MAKNRPHSPIIGARRIMWGIYLDIYLGNMLQWEKFEGLVTISIGSDDPSSDIIGKG